MDLMNSVVRVPPDKRLRYNGKWGDGEEEEMKYQDREYDTIEKMKEP